MPDKNFAPERQSPPIAGIAAGLAVLLGIFIFSFGFWLAWHPLGYITGGLSIAALGVLLGRRVQHSSRRRA